MVKAWLTDSLTVSRMNCLRLLRVLCDADESPVWPQPPRCRTNSSTNIFHTFLSWSSPRGTSFTPSSSWGSAARYHSTSTNPFHNAFNPCHCIWATCMASSSPGDSVSSFHGLPSIGSSTYLSSPSSCKFLLPIPHSIPRWFPRSEGVFWQPEQKRGMYSQRRYSRRDRGQTVCYNNEDGDNTHANRAKNASLHSGLWNEGEAAKTVRSLTSGEMNFVDIVQIFHGGVLSTPVFSCSCRFQKGKISQLHTYILHDAGSDNLSFLAGWS